jgi:hypothetical protein
VERADLLECFPGDRRLATIGDLVEAPAQMRSAKGENHPTGAAGCPDFTLQQTDSY